VVTSPKHLQHQNAIRSLPAEPVEAGRLRAVTIPGPELVEGQRRVRKTGGEPFLCVTVANLKVCADLTCGQHVLSIKADNNQVTISPPPRPPRKEGYRRPDFDSKLSHDPAGGWWTASLPCGSQFFEFRISNSECRMPKCRGLQKFDIRYSTFEFHITSPQCTPTNLIHPILRASAMIYANTPAMRMRSG
jgi:hypothetical protein